VCRFLDTLPCVLILFVLSILFLNDSSIMIITQEWPKKPLTGRTIVSPCCFYETRWFLLWRWLPSSLAQTRRFQVVKDWLISCLLHNYYSYKMYMNYPEILHTKKHYLGTIVSWNAINSHRVIHKNNNNIYDRICERYLFHTQNYFLNFELAPWLCNGHI